MKWKIFYKDDYSLTTTEKYILNYIEENKEFFAKAKMSDISKKGNFSISSISKLVRKLGFKNFKEMQIYASIEIQKNSKKSQNSDNKLLNIAEMIKLKYEISIERTVREIDLAMLEKLISAIKNKRYIYSFGIGSSRLAALELANNLMSIGYQARIPNSIHDIFKFIDDKNKKQSLVIIFSKLLHGKELEVMREVFAQAQIEVFLVTSNFGTNKYPNEQTIFIRTSEQEKRISALSSKIAQQFIVDLITNYIGRKQDNKVFIEFNKRWRE